MSLSNTSYLHLSGVGGEEVYVITLVYRTIPIKNSVLSPVWLENQQMARLHKW